MNSYHIISFILFLSSICNALNLTLTDYHDPAANHILDAEIVDNTLIISAMVQGIEFYDVTVGSNLNHLAHFTLGGGVRANCVRANGNYAYFTSSNGLYVVNISNPANPQSLGNISNTSNLILENLDLEDNILAVCAHVDGVILFDISNPANPVQITTIEVNNAWAVALLDDYAYIASNDEILVVDVSDINLPTLLTTIPTGNAVKDVAIEYGFLYAALGSDGVDIYSLDDPINPQNLANYNTTTMAHRIAPMDNYMVAVADWDDVEVLEWDGSNLVLVGHKNTGNRTMAIAVKDNFIYSAEWASVQTFEFGEIQGPDIDLSTWELNYPFVDNGSSYTLSLEVTNNGNSLLIVTDQYTSNPDFQIDNHLQNLSPGEAQWVNIIYTADGGNSSGGYNIFSSDTDEPQIICETNGNNINGINIGEPAPDFNLDYVANESGSFQLSDHLDEVVVLAFFSPQ